MNGRLDLLLILAVGTTTAGLGSAAYQLALNPPAHRPCLGVRGLKRTRSLDGRVFRWTEPVLRYLAGLISWLSLQRLRSRIEKLVLQTGSHLGLSADEMIACSLVSALSMGFLAGTACIVLHLPPFVVPFGILLGLCAPIARLSGIAKSRGRSVNRALPGTVELASLCMSAGLDFTGSLHKIVDTAADQSDPLVEEFSRILQELELGHTRRRALQGFAERVPTDQVKEFVSTVVQAEEKGSPLSDVLTIQAQTQRLRRSIAAEEAASKAALMLVGPMSLIFLCVLLLVLGPLIVRFMAGELSVS